MTPGSNNMLPAELFAPLASNSVSVVPSPILERRTEMPDGPTSMLEGRAFLHRLAMGELVSTYFRGPLDLDNLTGETWEMRLAYRSLMLKEPSIKTALISKVQAVASLDPQMIPDDGENPADKAAAKFADWAIERGYGGWQKLIESIALPALIDGFGVSEKLLTVTDSPKYAPFWTLRKLYELDTQYVRFDIDRFKEIKKIRLVRTLPATTFDPRDFVIFQHMQLFESPFGISDLRASYRAASLIEAAIKLRAILLENFSGPFVVGKYPDGDQGVRQNLATVLAKARSLGWLTIPASAEVEVIDLAQKSNEAFQSAIDDLRKEIYTGIRGAYLPFTEASAGVERGDTSVQKSITEIFEFWLAGAVCEVINSQIIPDLIVPNFGTRVGLPRAKLGGMNLERAMKHLELIEKVYALTGDVSKRQIYELTRIEPSRDDEDRLPPQGQGAAPPGPLPGQAPDAGGALPAMPGQQFRDQSDDEEFPVQFVGFDEPGSWPPAGGEGQKLAAILQPQIDAAARVIVDKTRASLNRRFPAYSDAELWTREERTSVVNAIATALTLADMLARGRLNQPSLDEETQRKFADPPSAGGGIFPGPSDTPFVFVTKPIKPLGQPELAVQYIQSLVPTPHVDALHLADGWRRKAFTMAVDAEAKVLEKVKDAVLGELATGGDATATVRKVLEDAGLNPKNPQYAQMVVRTNVMDAYETGFRDELRQNPRANEDFPVWQYVGIRDGRQGEDHEPHFGHYFPASVDFRDVRGPRVYNCRCIPKPIYKSRWKKLEAEGATLDPMFPATHGFSDASNPLADAHRMTALLCVAADLAEEIPGPMLGRCLTHLADDVHAFADACGLTPPATAVFHTMPKYDESKHPRDDHGRWIEKGDIARAKTDPRLAQQLRSRTTNPRERAKLDRAIESAPTGRARGKDLANKARIGQADANDNRELLDNVGHMTHHDLRDVRSSIEADPGHRDRERQGITSKLAGRVRDLASGKKPLPAHPAVQKLHSAIDDSKLDSDKKKQYAAAVAKTTDRMPTAALDRIARNLDNVGFHAEAADVGKQAVASAMKREFLTDEQRADINQHAKNFKSGRVKPGAVYIPKQKELHLDGGLSDKYQSHEVYAHALAHAIDGPDHEVSSSPQWQVAWQREIQTRTGQKPKLNQYAGTNASEGFAEFCRYVYGQGKSRAEMSVQFPLATAVMKQHGLFPEATPYKHPGDSPITEQAMNSLAAHVLEHADRNYHDGWHRVSEHFDPTAVASVLHRTKSYTPGAALKVFENIAKRGDANRHAPSPVQPQAPAAKPAPQPDVEPGTMPEPGSVSTAVGNQAETLHAPIQPFTHLAPVMPDIFGERIALDMEPDGAHVDALKPSHRADGTPHEPENQHVYTVPTASLKVDPQRFQYKVAGIGEKGVTKELSNVSKWDPNLGGVVLGWRDPQTGEDYVINGHHRHELASRVGHPEMNVRYINAPTAKEARAIGALANIAEGRGKAIDAAKYLRDSGQTLDHLKNSGISMSSKIVGDAGALNQLGDKPFQAVTEGRLDEGTAVAVGRHLADPKLQDVLFSKIKKREADGRDWSTREIETAAKKMAAAGKATVSGEDLFGKFEDEKSTFDQEVDLQSFASRKLAQQVGDYAAVGNVKRADRVSGAGNVLAVDENQKRKQTAAARADAFEQFANLKGPVSATIQKYAAELAQVGDDKKRSNDVRERFYAELQNVLDNPAGGEPVAADARGSGESRAQSPDEPAPRGEQLPATDHSTRVRDEHLGENFRTQLTGESAAIDLATQKRAHTDYPQLANAYLAKGLGDRDADGSLKSVVLNTDEWRDLFPEYKGTNAHEVHEASSTLNKKMLADALVQTRGKGNNKLLVLAGGGGSGKGTATRGFIQQSQYPITLDQVSDNYGKLKQKLDEARANGFEPQFVFVDRNAADAWTHGVVKRAATARAAGEMARTVPLAVALKANIDARKTALKFLQENPDADATVIDNNRGPGQARIITDRDEAIQYLTAQDQSHNHDELHGRLLNDTLDLHESGGLPVDLAEGLVGREAIHARRNEPRPVAGAPAGNAADAAGAGGTPGTGDQGAGETAPASKPSSRSGLNSDIEFESDLQRDLHELAHRMRSTPGRKTQAAGSGQGDGSSSEPSRFRELLRSLIERTGLDEKQVRDLAVTVRDDVATQLNAADGVKKVRDTRGIEQLIAERRAGNQDNSEPFPGPKSDGRFPSDDDLVVGSPAVPRKPGEPIPPPPDEKGGELETNLLGEKKRVFRTKKGQQTDIRDQLRDSWPDKAQEWADANGHGAIEQTTAGGDFRIGDQWFKIGNSENGFAVEKLEKPPAGVSPGELVVKTAGGQTIPVPEADIRKRIDERGKADKPDRKAEKQKVMDALRDQAAELLVQKRGYTPDEAKKYVTHPNLKTEEVMRDFIEYVTAENGEPEAKHEAEIGAENDRSGNGNEPAGHREDGVVGRTAASEADAGSHGQEGARGEADESDVSDPHVALAHSLADKLRSGGTVTKADLYKLADEHHGGSRAEGVYKESEAADSLEAAFNLSMQKNTNLSNARLPLDQAIGQARAIEEQVNRLPTQTVRTGNKISHQQFSTPPHYSYAAAWIANLRPGDITLEPSAGTGDLAVHAENAGAKVIANELDPRRAEFLKALFGDENVHVENAEHIASILKMRGAETPTTVLMNPPFSSSAGRVQKKQIMTAANHIGEAMEALAPGGRLVAIVGEGMAPGKPAYRDWFEKMSQKYNLRANVGVSGDEYRKYGTNFGTRMLVFDKTPPQGQPVTGDATDIPHLMTMLEGVRNDRYGTTAAAPTEQVRGTVPAGDEVSSGAGRDASVDAGRGVAEAGAETIPVPDESGRVRGGDRQPDRSGSVGSDGPAGDGLRTSVAADARSDSNAGQAGNSGRSVDGTPATPAGNADGVKGRAKPRRKSVSQPTVSLPDLRTPELIPVQPIATKPGHNEETAKSIAGTASSTVSNFVNYQPTNMHIPGARPHTTQLVEPAALAAIKPPAATYRPMLSPDLISGHLEVEKRMPDGTVIRSQCGISEAGLEAVVYAGQAHEKFLPGTTSVTRGEAVVGPNGEQGKVDISKNKEWIVAGADGQVYASGKNADHLGEYLDSKKWKKAGGGSFQNRKRMASFVGDGTGTGKGRIGAGILSDSFNRGYGNRKGVWFSEKHLLLADAKRDWADVGQNPDDIIHIEDLRKGKYTHGHGIVFLPYTSIIKGDKDGNHVDNLAKWLGPDFDGPIYFDEAHNMGNADDTEGDRGIVSASQQATACLDLENRFPNARVTYASATGATKLENLTYMGQRLGLWGRGTEFADRAAFVSAMQQGGLGGLEAVAQSCKARGLYSSRSISYNDVKFQKLAHEMTHEDKHLYNGAARAWRAVFENIDAVMDHLTDGNTDKAGRARGNAASQFWGAQLRYFTQVITTMKARTVIAAAQKDIAEGRAPVISLVNTGGSNQKRAMKNLKEGDDLENLDLSPNGILTQFLETSFPIHKMQEVTKMREDGTSYTVWEKVMIQKKDPKTGVPMKDEAGRPVMEPVVDPHALEVRNGLITRVNEMPMSKSPLDMVVHALGHENVAEATGRKTRLVYKPDQNGVMKLTEDHRGDTDKTNAAEINAFMDGKKHALIFNEAAGTGGTFSADRSRINQKQRHHYQLQLSWRADKNTQVIGRTHRTNQASAPVIFLTEIPDLPGEKRVTSTTARRMMEMGALTRGQAKGGATDMFTRADNLEAKEAQTGLDRFMGALEKGHIPSLDHRSLMKQMGMAVKDDAEGDKGKKPELPMRKFLNRIMVLDVEDQQKVFGELNQYIAGAYADAEKAGTLDTGVENFPNAQRIEKTGEQTVAVHPVYGSPTNLMKANVTTKMPRVSFEQVQGMTDADLASFAGTDAEKEKARKQRPQGYVIDKYDGQVWAYRRTSSYTDLATGQVQWRLAMKNPAGHTKYIPESDLHAPVHKDDPEFGYTAIDAGTAKTKWDEAYDKLPDTETNEEHFVTGDLLNVFSKLPAQANRIYKLPLSDGTFAVGRHIPKNMVETTVRNLGAAFSKERATPESAMQKVAAGRGTATLGNGWTLRRSNFQGEQRVELVGPTSLDKRQLMGDGVLMVNYQYRDRYFLPSGDDGTHVLKKLLASKNDFIAKVE